VKAFGDGLAAILAQRGGMGRQQKRLARIVAGRSDANVRFDDICALLRAAGFRERIQGSHHIFERPGVPRLINLQRQGSSAKTYQVRQVRRILIEYGLTELRLEDDP
jgi:hypothetical protein